MSPRVSLKPIETVIRKTESKLRKLSRTAPTPQRAEIKQKIKRLDLMIKEVRVLCRGYNVAFKA
jgi:hypothetical protein